MDQISLRPSTASRRVGDYRLEELLTDSPTGTYQDWKGRHASIDSGLRLIRIYQEGLQSAQDRTVLRRAAEREFRILERLDHPGILRVDTLTPTEAGPALVFRWQEGTQRLDHYLASQETTLPLHVSLGIVHQIADAVAYAHRQKVVHRALSPQSILVQSRPETDVPLVQIFNWQLGLIGAGTTQVTRTRFSSSLHAGQLMEESSLVYLAPEAVAGQSLEGEELDSFSIGALAFRLFSGKPPAESLLQLDEKLRGDGSLDLCSVMNGVTHEMNALIQFTVTSQRKLRFSAGEILDQLGKIEDELTRPAAAEVVDPRLAGPKSRLLHSLTVVRDLGTGSCSRVLLVEGQDGIQKVLKIASKDDYNERVCQEYGVLRKINYPCVVKPFELLDFAGCMGFTMEPAGEVSLARRIRDDGPLEIELLERFGEQLLRTLDHLEQLGISHRDIKPDNLGIRSFAKGPLQLVLFDFSLVGTPAENIRVGTPFYLDPFLPERKLRRWDYHAERFSAAATLYEMATGSHPRWGDRDSLPTYQQEEVTLELERLPEGLRDDLAAFFRKAMCRDVAERFDNTPEMVAAWKKVFAAADQPALPKPGKPSPEPDDTTLAEVLDSATGATPLLMLGLSTRLANVLDRLGLHTVEDFLNYPIGKILKQRGVGNKTRRDAEWLHTELRQRLPEVTKDDRARRVKEAAETPEDGAEFASVDLIAKQLLVSAGGKQGSRDRQIIEQYLGWTPFENDPGATRWPSQSDLGELVDVTRARVGQIVIEGRKRWLKNPVVTGLREEIHAQLLRHGGVMTHEELIRMVLLTRGSTLPEPECLQMASIATRAAVEAERQLKEPRFQDFRRQHRILIALDPALVDFAQQLAKVAGDLAGRDPLPTPVRVVETLGGVGFPAVAIPDLRHPDQARRVNLAASGTPGVALNSRLELYPRGMAAHRALKLSQSVLVGLRELSPSEIRERVRSRYPEAEPLPPRPQLDDLLTGLGYALDWDPSARGGNGAYRSKHASVGSPGATRGTFTRFRTNDGRNTPEVVDEAVAEAVRLETKLTRARNQGSYLALAVDPRLMNKAVLELQRFQVAHLSADQLFLDAMKEQANAFGVTWDVVLRADAAKPGSPDWTRLQELVRRALPQVLERLRQPAETILLTDAGLFARYGKMHLLDTLRHDAGTAAGPFGLWLLVPSHGASFAPSLCGEAVPITNPAQFETLTKEWVLNRHRGEAA
jgi:serine/threonine protein kinase